MSFLRTLLGSFKHSKGKYMRTSANPSVISDLGGTKGTVVCFHGHNADGSAAVWGQPGDNGDFVRDLRQAGFSYICPPSKEGMWSDVNDASNPDILAVQSIINSFPNAPRPFYFVGHSNGGGFVTRMAVYSSIKPAAVQYSNSFGITGMMSRSGYSFPSLFCFSQKDPTVDYARVLESIQALVGRKIFVATNDLTGQYASGRSNHEFLNTSSFTATQFSKFRA